MFNDELQFGEIGEYVVWNLLQREKQTRAIFDVRDDTRFFRGADVDFLVQDYNRDITWIEVKTDQVAYRTGNFVYEIEYNGKIGVFEKTKADFIAYYVPQSGIVYMLNVPALRKRVASGDYPIKEMGRSSKGYVIPIADLERFGVIAHEYHTTQITNERTDRNERERIDT